MCLLIVPVLILRHWGTKSRAFCQYPGWISFFQSQGAHGGSPSLRQSHMCLNATTPKEYSGSAVPSPWVQCQERDHLYPYV